MLGEDQRTTKGCESYKFQDRLCFHSAQCVVFVTWLLAEGQESCRCMENLCRKNSKKFSPDGGESEKS